MRLHDYVRYKGDPFYVNPEDRKYLDKIGRITYIDETTRMVFVLFDDRDLNDSPRGIASTGFQATELEIVQ